MAGIYIHIPFCKQACYYCDFYFSTSQRLRSRFIESLISEWQLESAYLNGEPIDSIYFGGGTPSLLSPDEINRICDAIFNTVEVREGAEITLEANPDDLTADKLNGLRNTAINRLSIGVQSFFEEDLKWMNRAHNAEEAIRCIKAAQDAGFLQLTLDLIYGVPGMTTDRWEKNLDTFFSLQVPHLSAYSLTVEKNTPLHRLIQRGRYTSTDDGLSAVHFDILMQQMDAYEFVHYEISNFASTEANVAKHNSSYWKGVPYLGLGPSAHSYNGSTRRSNVASLQKYVDAIDAGNPVHTTEQLSVKNRYNEYILTGLRTMWGVSAAVVQQQFGEQLMNYFTQQIKPHVQNAQVIETNGAFSLSRSGKMFADTIAADLFYSDN